MPGVTPPHRELLVSARGILRQHAAGQWLRNLGHGVEVLIIGPTLDAVDQLVRTTAAETATFGWHRLTINQLAGRLGGPVVAQSGRVPAPALTKEAAAASVVRTRWRAAGLGRFVAIGDRPGLPRALCRTFEELDRNGVNPKQLSTVDADLGALFAEYLAFLTDNGFATRSEVVRAAKLAVEDGKHPLVGLPLLIYDFPLHTRTDNDLIRALSATASTTFASIPAGDTRSLLRLQSALDVVATRPEQPVTSAVERIQEALFEAELPASDYAGGPTVISAPGENRECVEIARRILQEARSGTRFDRMAVLLRTPTNYRPHLIEAFGRAEIPVHFSRGALRPDPNGRAFLALLACAAESLSARRFAEFLSLGVAVAPDAAGAPSAPGGRPGFVPIVDELLVRPSQNLDAANSTLGQDEPSNDNFVPRAWEKLLVEAAIVGGDPARWTRRLVGLETALEARVVALDADGDPASEIFERRLKAVRKLRAYALPLIQALADLPESAAWGQWLTALDELATRALADPTRVRELLSELSPMRDVGPVTLEEIQLVLGRSLTDLLVPPSGSPAGKVFVGTTEEARGLCFDVVFIPGLAEKSFPQKVVEDPLLLDTARQRLGEWMVETPDRVAVERSHLRQAVGAARRALVLSYPRVDTERSRGRVPSFYGLEILRALRGKLAGFDELLRRADRASELRLGWPAPQDPKLAIDATEYDLAILHSLLERDGDNRGAARYLLSVNRYLPRALRARGRRWLRAFRDVDGLVDPPPTTKQLLQRFRLRDRAYSPTALEQYAACPYRFYLHAIMRLSPRETAEPVEELDPLERGRIYHEVQRELSLELARRGLLPLAEAHLTEAEGLLDATLDAVETQHRDALIPAIERVWEDAIAELRKDLRAWLGVLVQETRWVPAHFELAFGLAHADATDAASRKQAVVLPVGVKLRGAIDLVEKHGRTLRATDYKTGLPRHPAHLVVAGGHALQPALYALALERIFPKSHVESGRLVYSTRRGGFESREVRLDDGSRSIVERVLDRVDDAIARGFLPAAPDSGACFHCRYLSVCGPYEEQRTAMKQRGPLEQLIALRKEP